MKITDNDTIVEKALEIAEELNLLDDKGNWKSDEARNKAYSEVYQKHEINLK